MNGISGTAASDPRLFLSGGSPSRSVKGGEWERGLPDSGSGTAWTSIGCGGAGICEDSGGERNSVVNDPGLGEERS